MRRENGNDLSVSGVASVDRALSVLTAFRRGDKALSLAELTRRTGLVKTTVLRLAISLEQTGLLKRLDDGGYRLDAEVLRLASIYQDQIDLEDLVVPVLRQLVEMAQESASFYIQRGEHRMCLFRVDSPHRLRLHIRPGDLLPMDELAIAQVLRIFDDRESTRPTMPTLPIYTAGKRDPHTAGLAMPVLSGEFGARWCPGDFRTGHPLHRGAREGAFAKPDCDGDRADPIAGRRRAAAAARRIALKAG